MPKGSAKSLSPKTTFREGKNVTLTVADLPHCDIKTGRDFGTTEGANLTRLMGGMDTRSAKNESARNRDGRLKEKSSDFSG